jgi:hypothetical protein
MFNGFQAVHNVYIQENIALYLFFSGLPLLPFISPLIGIG